MRVLIDTNIVLDVLLERQPFAEEATALFETVESGGIEGYVGAATLTDIFYIVRKGKGIETANQAISRILAVMQVCPVDRGILEQAILLNLADFEDAVQLACAIAANIDAIITRNAQDFAEATLPILSAGELLERLPY